MDVKQAHALLALRKAVDERDEAEATFQARAELARMALTAALEAGVGVNVVARAARISRQRVWQIRQNLG